MSTTETGATAAPEPRRSFLRRISQGTKKAARATGHGIVRGAKATGRVTKKVAQLFARGARKTARGTKRGIGYVGLALAHLVLFVARVVFAVAVFLVTAVISLVSMAVFAVLALAHAMIRVWRTWVVGFFSWLSSPFHMSFREHRIAERNEREATNAQAWAQVTDAIKDAFTEAPAEDEATVDFEEPIVVERETMSTADRKALATLEEKARVRVQADLDDEALAFPGVKATQAETEDPYGDPTTEYRIDNPVLAVMGRWVDKHDDKTEVDFRFEGEWLHETQMEALLILASTATTHVERAYWVGRQEALRWVMTRPDNLDAHGKGWALTWSSYRNRQRDYPLRYMRAGFGDMIADLKVQRDKADRRAREQAAANGHA